MVLEVNPRFGASLCLDIDRYLEAYADSLNLVSKPRQVIGNSQQMHPTVSNLQGAVELFAGRFLAGWAMSPDKPHDALEVEVVADGEIVVECRACEYRPDLDQAAIGTGWYGFRAMLPRRLLDSDRARNRCSIKGYAPVSGGLSKKDASRRFLCRLHPRRRHLAGVRCGAFRRKTAGGSPCGARYVAAASRTPVERKLISCGRCWGNWTNSVVRGQFRRNRPNRNV